MTIRTVTIKRRFAVILEDAIHATVPDDIDLHDPEAVKAWAQENSDELWDAANQRRDLVEAGADDAVAEHDEAGGPRWMWEDEHHADLGSFDEEYEVDIDALEVP